MKNLTGARKLDTLARWTGTCAGLAVSSISFFAHKPWATISLFLLGLLVIAVSNFREYIAYNENKKRDARIESVSANSDAIALVAQAASQATSRTAEELKRGRRLSPDQMAAIADSLSGERLSDIRATAAYDPAATEALDFAQSITDFLQNKLNVRCDGPHPINPTGSPRPRQPVRGTLFIVRSNPSAMVERFVKAFSSAVPEIQRSGEGIAGEVSPNSQIAIVVGNKP